MTEIELTNEYNNMLQRLKSQPMYDGRGKGVDMYVCEKCGKLFYTRYKDLGVTPFTIRCRNKECNGTMVHERTIDKMTSSLLDPSFVHNWVRPSLEWLNNQRQKGNLGVVDHVLNGGLILEDES